MKIRNILLAATAVVLSVSCSDKKSEQASNVRSEFLRPSDIEYSKQDSTEILKLVNEYVKCMKEGDIESSAYLIYNLHNDSIHELSETEKKGYLLCYSSLPIFDVSMKSFLLRGTKNNEVKLAVQIFEDGSIAEGKGVTYLSLNPVLVDGRWYLTLLDKEAEGVRDIYQEELANKQNR